MPTIIELEALDQLLEGVEVILAQEMYEERKSFEEGCNDLDHDLIEASLEEIRELGKKNNIETHSFITLCEMQEALPVLKLLLKTSLVGNPMARYSEYFKNKRTSVSVDICSH